MNAAAIPEFRSSTQPGYSSFVASDPRRVRARLEREDMLDALAAEMIERKALDLVLDHAEYEEVPLTAEDQPAVSTVEAQAVPGEMKEPTAEAPVEETPASPE